jgi:hypothetical protein
MAKGSGMVGMLLGSGRTIQSTIFQTEKHLKQQECTHVLHIFQIFSLHFN